MELTVSYKSAVAIWMFKIITLKGLCKKMKPNST